MLTMNVWDMTVTVAEEGHAPVEHHLWIMTSLTGLPALLCVVVSRAFKAQTPDGVVVSEDFGVHRVRAVAVGARRPHFKLEVRRPVFRLGGGFVGPLLGLEDVDRFWGRLQAAARQAFRDVGPLREMFEGLHGPAEGRVEDICRRSASGAAAGVVGVAGAEEAEGAEGAEEVDGVDTRAERRLLMCPISGRAIVDHVCTSEGTVCERSALMQWFAEGEAGGRPPADPLTGAPLKTVEWWAIPVSYLEREAKRGPRWRLRLRRNVVQDFVHPPPPSPSPFDVFEGLFGAPLKFGL
jgi:hypothetical protein